MNRALEEFRMNQDKAAGAILPMIAADLYITLPEVETWISAFALGALIGAPPFAILTL